MEVVQSSITGAFRMILIIIGALVVLRFVGQLMQAKRNLAEEEAMNRKRKAFDAEAKRKRKNFGRMNVLGKNQKINDAIEDAEYEEVE